MKPEEFARKPRIIGTEMEYTFHTGESNVLAQYHMLRKLPFGLVGVSFFLSNGSRFYPDINGIPEYATPESAGARAAVAAELAGEIIVGRLAEEYSEEHKIEPVVKVFKNIADSVGDTRGHHENYLMLRSHSLQDIYDGLAAHLVSRVAFTGLGYILPQLDPSQPPVFTLSQKARAIMQEMSELTTRTKPLFNTRDQPHSSQDVWRRLHVTSGDSNISEWAQWYTLASTSAVLRLIEEGCDLSHIQPKDPLDALKVFSTDLTLTTCVETRSGKKMSAVDIQEAQIEAIRKHILSKRDDPELKEYTEEGQEACDDSRKDPYLLADRADWAAKATLLFKNSKDSDSREVDLPWVEAKYTDIQYGNITDGLGIKLCDEGKLRSIVTTKEVKERIKNPPTDTRAAARAIEVVKRSRAKNSEAPMDWSVAEQYGEFKNVKFNDPYSSR